MDRSPNSPSSPSRVFSFFLFDRKGRCLFDADLSPVARDREPSEEAKLVYGLLFSLKGVSKFLSDDSTSDLDLNSVRTDRYALHQIVSPTGFRFVLTTALLMSETKVSEFLKRVYSEIFVKFAATNPLFDFKTVPPKFVREFGALADATFFATTNTTTK